MNKYIYVLMLVIMASAETIKSKDICNCNQIDNEMDCKAISICTWTAAAPATQTSVAVVASCWGQATTILPYCESSMTPVADCWKTLGCAYLDNKCTNFSGCSAYAKTTNSDCQAISYLCITDGKQCTEAKSCTDYTTESQCTTNSSISGIRRCKWDNNICRDYNCNEADSTLSTDKACNDWLSGCITTGKGCTKILTECASYVGNDKNCSGLIGIDGYCEGTEEGLKCNSKNCNGAPITFVTDKDCNAYQIGCITNRKGCSTNSLAPCVTYLGDITTCDGYIGSDGICEGDVEGTNCRGRMCQNAPESNNSDQLCNEYKYGCLSNGYGCVDTRGPCSSYPITKCDGYIGSNGRCKQTGATCSLRICSEAPITIYSNEVCDAYQTGCVNNGQKISACLNQTTCQDTIYTRACEGTTNCQFYASCVDIFDSCSQYTNPSICMHNEKFCAWVLNESVCVDVKCYHASYDKHTTDEQCNKFIKGCVTNGNGCIQPNDPCSSFKGTQTQCQSYKNTKCTNVASANNNTPCTIRQCADITTDTTDLACQTYLSTCRSNGNGCISDSEPCSSYDGNQNKCDLFRGSYNTQRCWNISITNFGSCTEKLCIHNTIAQSDLECETFLSGCVSSGLGCISNTLSCSSYSGTQLQCNKFKGNSGTNECWNINDSGLCTEKLCTHASTDLKSDTDCGQFMTGCLTNGSGCVSPTVPCTQYSGTLIQCSVFIGNKQKCYGQDKCDIRKCDQKSNPNNDADCKMYLSTCSYFNGSCMTSTNCTSYIGTSISLCQDVLNDSKVKCWWTTGSTTCIDRSCANAPTLSQTSCTDHLKTCQFDGSICISSNTCSNYVAFGIDSTTKKTNCQALQNLFGVYCEYTTGSNCTDQACTYTQSSYTNQALCDQYFKDTCFWNGQACVVKYGCSKYIPSGFDSNKIAICNGIKINSTDYCTFYSGVCKPRLCGNNQTASQASDCTNYLSTCRYTGVPICVTANDNCNYEITGANDSAKLNACELLTNTAGGLCTFLSGTNTCKIKLCSEVLTPTNQSACTIIKSSCQFSATSQPCVDTNTYCTYSIPSGLSVDGDKKVYCEGLSNGSGNQCTYSAGATACRLKICSESGTSPVNSAACITIKTSCQFISSSIQCTEADTGCGYTPSSGTELAYCQALNNGSGNQCDWTSGSSTCRLRICGDLTTSTNQSACTAIKSSCQFSVTTQPCVDTNTYCTYSIPSGLTVDGDKKVYCEGLSNGSGNQCTYSSGATTCRLGVCVDITNPANKAACTSIKSSCQFGGNDQPCFEKITSCTYILPVSMTSDANRLTYCLALNNGSGQQCGYKSGDSTCSFSDCSQILTATDTTACANQISTCDIINYSGCSSKSCDNFKSTPTSNEDCTSWSNDCRFNGSICINSFASCEYILAGSIASDTNSQKQQFCKQLTNSSNVGCALNTAQTGCTMRTCANIMTTPTSKNDCTNWLPTCRYNGYGCINANTCSNYTADSSINAQITDNSSKANYCLNLTSNASPPVSCGFVNNATACTDRTCSNIRTIPTYNSDCYAWVKSCILSNSVIPICIENTSPCTAFNGTASQCQSYSQVTGNEKVKCWSVSGASSTTPVACKVRVCTDNTISTTNYECSEFLTGCKYNGTLGCALMNAIPCSSYLGNISTCANYQSIDAHLCTLVGQVSSGPCTTRVCTDDNTSTTNEGCSQFLSGCVTKGIGCIEDTAACSKYQGDQFICSAFKGNGQKCWNSSQASSISYCVNRKCSDDETSTTNIACENHLSGCVTKGTGCIENTAPCSSYKGSQATCSVFRGNKTTRCWNANAADVNTPCYDKACADNIIGRTDADCDVFLPRLNATDKPKCVTNGTNCVVSSTNCAQFVGTTAQCGLFTASDGPCKSTSATISANCTQRICTEALNSLNTDALCKSYHSSCVTNGYGCVRSVSCRDVQGYNACRQKTGCESVENCHASGPDCSARTKYGASVCVATPNTTQSKCAWYNNECREITCDDLPATITTHSDCQKVSPLCTTTGSGCTTIGVCTTHAVESVCKAIGNSDQEKACIWNTNTLTCENKKCSDAPTGTTTDSQCQDFLIGCKTNGISCIENGFSCPSLLTAVSCVMDSFKNPCLFVNNICYNYSKCEDIIYNTHEVCQKFSPQCTSDGKKCIAISTCAKAVTQPSCRIGIDGICGWLPIGKCQIFGTCSDVAGTDNLTCSLYGSNCITDGTKCIDKNTCSSYSNKILCVSGTDGICQYDSNANYCKLKECSDATTLDLNTTTHTGCYAFATAKTKCTTNGTSCIALSTCISQLESGCVLGTDGPCIFDFPIGQITGTKACRQKACGDFKFSSSSQCSTYATQNAITTECVSDGTVCIVKAACSTYTNKEACNGGGTDGLCAFNKVSTTNPYIGTCKLMKACTDANNDLLACNAKLSTCYWNASTEECNPHTCVTLGSGTTCVSVPSFDLQTYTICGLAVNGGCTEAAGSSFVASTCQFNTMNTYTWNETKKECTACFSKATAEPGNTTGAGAGTGTGTTTTQGNIIKSLVTLVILGIIVI